ncbi:MAG: 1-(5-phosphoribosyl)-5-[(5-phosphoribosylamino)methylideneamino]imidazole-4-carboxamide isomerase [Dehalococcoidia bacterium]
MEVIPAIDIRGGRCVQLTQGDFQREAHYGDDPLAMAERWIEEGATRLHIVDLDGARAGAPAQREIILRLVDSVGDRARLQVGGGIRTLKDAGAYLDAGVERVILGSAAIKDQATVVNACSRYPGRVIVSIDARRGRVATEAWHETTEVGAVELAEELEAAGVPRFLYTDIERDGMLQGPNVEALKAMVQALSAPVIASGGIGSLDDISAVEAAGAEAVIVGTALYEGRVSLREALASVRISQ